jgi:hypothetical protein
MIPLSFAQQQQWLLHQLEGPAATYNIPLALELTGELDRAALAAAYRDVVARHLPLRVRFTAQDGIPGQVAANPPDGPLPLIDAAGPGELDRALARAAAYRFDLTAETPVLATLFAAGPRRHVLLILMHHIAADGWSLRPLARDLSAAYAARQAGRVPAFEPLAATYPDYVAWQRETMGDQGGLCPATGAGSSRPASTPACTRPSRTWPARAAPRCSWCCTPRWPRC